MEWANNVQACTKTGHNRAKGVVGTLDNITYWSRNNLKKDLVKRDVRDGELDLTPDTEIPENYQLMLVKKVVYIVAADSPAEYGRSIDRLNMEANGCTWGSDE